MRKPALIVTALLILILAVVSGLRSRGQESELIRLENSPEAGTLKWYSDVAKAKGETEAVFSAGLHRYVAVKDLDECLKHFTVLLGEPLEAKSYATDSRSITTWYRFKVIDTFLERDTTHCSTCPQPPRPPTDLIVPNAHEVLIPRHGGSVNFDGIKLTSIEADFPNFKTGQQYLLFMSFNSQTRVGTIQLGPWGVFQVNPDLTVRSVKVDATDGLGTDIKKRFSNSLTNLKPYLRQLPRP